VGGNLIDDVGVFEITGDPQPVDTPSVKRQAAVTEVHPQQIGIGLLVDVAAIAAEAAGASSAGPVVGAPTTLDLQPDSPVADGAPRDAQSATDLAVVDSQPDELQSPPVLGFGSHVGNVQRGGDIYACGL
jgi:hypothetical protein